MEIEKLVQKIWDAGGEPYWVGGCVRDMLLKREPKDYDLIVFKLKPEKLEEVLSSLGKWKKYGKVQGIWAISGIPVDISLSEDSIERDALTRDFTLNAIYQHAVYGNILDPLKGQGDLKNGVLRMVGPHSFQQDPLRVYRSFQLIARFHLILEEKTKWKVKEMEMEYIPMERIYEECRKWILAPSPELGYKSMKETGKLFPILKDLKRTDLETDLYHWLPYRNQSKSPELFMWTLLLLNQHPFLLKEKPWATFEELEQSKKYVRELQDSFYALCRHRQKSNDVGRWIYALVMLMKASRSADILRISLMIKKEEISLLAEALGKNEKRELLGDHWPQEIPTRNYNGKKLREMGIPEGPRMGIWLEIVFQLQLEGLQDSEIEAFIHKNKYLFQ